MKRLKRFLKWTKILLLSAVSLVILIVAFANWQASRQVEARLSPLRKTGKPVSIAELEPPAVPSEQNAAKAIALIDKLISDYDHQLAKATAETETDVQYDAAAIQVARDNSIAHPEFVAKLRDASQLTHYQLDYNYSLAPTPLMDQVLTQTRTVRTVVRILHGHGLLSLAEGKTDEAVLDAIAIFKWSKHFAQQPLLVNFLVSAALFDSATDLTARCLYAGDASPHLRTDLLSNVEQADLVTRFEETLDSERAFGISSFHSFPLSRFQFMLGELSAYLDMFAELEEIAEKTTGLAPQMPSVESHFAGSIWPALGEGLTVLRRSQAKARAIQILAAWQNAGSDKTLEIDDLELPESIVTDPFDGSSMKLKIVDDAVTVYSVGKNLADNDGSVNNEQDIGIVEKAKD